MKIDKKFPQKTITADCKQTAAIFCHFAIKAFGKYPNFDNEVEKSRNYAKPPVKLQARNEYETKIIQLTHISAIRISS